MSAKQDIHFFAWRLWKLLTDVQNWHVPSLNHLYSLRYICLKCWNCLFIIELQMWQCCSHFRVGWAFKKRIYNIRSSTTGWSWFLQKGLILLRVLSWSKENQGTVYLTLSEKWVFPKDWFGGGGLAFMFVQLLLLTCDGILFMWILFVLVCDFQFCVKTFKIVFFI